MKPKLLIVGAGGRMGKRFQPQLVGQSNHHRIACLAGAQDRRVAAGAAGAAFQLRADRPGCGLPGQQPELPAASAGCGRPEDPGGVPGFCGETVAFTAGSRW